MEELLGKSTENPIVIKIIIIAQLSLINSTLTEKPYVPRAFSILGGRDWDSFLLAYLQVYGTESLFSAASSLSLHIFLFSIVAFILIRVNQY